MRINTKKTKSIYPKVILIIIAVFVVGYLIIAKTTDRWPFSNTNSINSDSAQLEKDSDGTASSVEPSTDLPGLGEEEEEKKDETEDNPENPAPTAPDKQSDANKKAVSVTITTLYQEDGEVRANGFVSGVVESGGTCTLTLTDESGKTVSASRQGHENATNTTCGQSAIKTNRLHAGVWTASLSYSSLTSAGTSSATAPSLEVK